MIRAWLALADGGVFPGTMRGAAPPVVGEVVFTTGATGYQEVLTDPSYVGQLVVMTNVHIGNTGVHAADHESPDGAPRAQGMIVRELSRHASSERSESLVEAWFERTGTGVIAGVDTRRLTQHLRDHGSMTGAFGATSPEDLIRLARTAPSMTGQALAAQVTTAAPYVVTPSPSALRVPVTDGRAALVDTHVVTIDYGVKQNILRCLGDLGARVTVVPASTSSAAIRALAPDGVFLSNGPGDPGAMDDEVAVVRDLVGRTPIFGICLGHQLLARAVGARTFKLKFGHRGLNQPVVVVGTPRVLVTSQNHGFAVDEETLPKDVRITHRHADDGTNEGLEVLGARAFSVQFHPEAAAGTHDALDLFTRFGEMIASAP